MLCFKISRGLKTLPPLPAPPQVLVGNIFLSLDKSFTCITPTEKKNPKPVVDRPEKWKVICSRSHCHLRSRSLGMPCQQGALFVGQRLAVWSCLKAAPNASLLFAYCLFSGCAFFTDNVSFIYMYL